MRALPIGFPKIMVSTLASGNTAQYVGMKDIVMFPAIVDVSGINRISRQILTRAAGAICGMVEVGVPPSGGPDRLKPGLQTEDKPVIVASMFGNTTACVQHAQKILEQAGYEVLVFHATGIGGRTMESLIESGLVAGVLDITTTEWADELVGGILSAGPTRLEAAARNSVPAVVAPGCLDMVNFGPPETAPTKFKGRNFYQHNPQVTLMRTTPEECAELGRIMAGKLNLSTGPVSVLIPWEGISVISAPGQKFHDPDADQALFTGGEVLYFPTVGAPITVAYNLSGVDQLQLGPATLAGIMQADITTWNDPKIVADNSGATLPVTPIAVIHRSDGSGTTNNFTSYLTKAAPDVWKLGSGDAVNWPASTQGAEKNSGVAQLIQTTDGAIGYVDLADAVNADLSLASIQNSAGEFVEPTLAAASAAMARATVNPNLTYSPLNPPGADAYPITSPTWIIAYKKQPDAATAAALKGWLNFVLTDGQSIAQTIGYAPLPCDLGRKAIDQLDQITG